jgi:hypothetical protein
MNNTLNAKPLIYKAFKVSALLSAVCCLLSAVCPDSVVSRKHM